MPGINFDNHNKRQAEAANKKNKKTDRLKFFKAHEGKNRLRFLPPWTQDEANVHCGLPYKELHIHFGIGANDESNGLTAACPVKTPGGGQKSDPVCEVVRGLYNSGDPADKELAKTLQATRRWYSPIIDLDDPVYTKKDAAEWLEAQQDKSRDCPFKEGDTKIQIWSYGKRVYDQLAIFLADRIDFTDLETGFDMFIQRTGSGKNDTVYTIRTNTEGRTPFKFIGNLVERMPDLDQLMPYVEPEQMMNALSGNPSFAQLVAPTTPAVAQLAKPAVASTPTPAAAPAKGNGGTNVDDLMASIKAKMGMSE